MSAVEARLAEIEGRADAATKGPWCTWAGLDLDGSRHDTVGPHNDPEIEVCETPRTPDGIEDAEFIAAARTDVPELVAALRAVLALAEGWATQPTDYDEDTEQQIDDGHAVRDAITAALGVTP